MLANPTWITQCPPKYEKKSSPKQIHSANIRLPRTDTDLPTSRPTTRSHISYLEKYYRREATLETTAIKSGSCKKNTNGLSLLYAGHNRSWSSWNIGSHEAFFCSIPYLGVQKFDLLLLEAKKAAWKYTFWLLSLAWCKPGRSEAGLMALRYLFGRKKALFIGGAFGPLKSF